MKINIENCNCIKKAEIELSKNTLNIKYGLNGTGKSTISNAIYAKSLGKDERIQELLPYGTDTTNPDEMPNVGNLPFSKIRVFNETYVNQYVFQGDEFLKDSYSVFLKSDECDRLTAQIEKLLSELQGIFQNSPTIRELRNFLPEYFNAVKYKEGAVSKRGGVGEFIKGNGGGFEKYSVLDSYKPFYLKRPMSEVSQWAKWRNEGIKEIHGDNCPFCTKKLEKDIEQQNQVIGKVFKNSALSVANAVLGYLKKAVELRYINEDAIEALRSYIGNPGKSTELCAELEQLATETNYLDEKIEKICLFRPMNVTHEQLMDIENNLDNMFIEERQISKFYSTTFILDIVHQVAEKIQHLKKNTGKLKGLFLQHEAKLDLLIHARKEDINQFFALAGFPYEFCLDKNGEEKAMAYLVPALHPEQSVEKPEKRLSWGERNAFSLVMFMFEAISDDADLIVLDDPISSFDQNKKFAVIRRMFDNQKTSFRDRTVMMLTHDLQPIIDYIHGSFFKTYGLTTPVDAKLLQNIDGQIIECDITSNDLKNTVELTREIAKNDQEQMHVRIVNLRKYVELIYSDFTTQPIYDVLSNIIHGRKEATDKEGKKLEKCVFDMGYQQLQTYIKGKSYDDIIMELSTTNLLQIIIGEGETYEKIIAIRLLFERQEDLMLLLRRKYPSACKFLNETNHVENDYIFQLDPRKFFSIPEYYLKAIKSFIGEEKNRIRTSGN